MLELLVSKFIKSNDFDDEKNRNKLISLTGYLGLFFNILLFAIKITIGLLINSISVISDAINNLSDSLSSLITILGAFLSSKPADSQHPYGHGRWEYLSTLAVGIAISAAGAGLFKNSIHAIINPQQVAFNLVSIIILIISIGIKVYMYIYNMRVYKITQSGLNKSQAVDSRNDVMTSTVVIISVILSSKFGIHIDGPVGLVVSIIIILSGIEILKEMSAVLVGQEIEEETINRIREILMEGAYVIGVHDIEIHDYGKKLLGTAHVEVPVNIDVYSMHAIVDVLEKKVMNELNIELSIHMDPCYCLEEDHFSPAPCKIRNKKLQEKVLEENSKARKNENKDLQNN